jgi:glycosyltransferase involved in cell wall biosynthesis
MNRYKAGKICLVANTDWYLYNFRLALAKALRGMGWEVLLISPAGPYTDGLAGEGFRWIEWRVDRRGLNIWRELRSMINLAKIYSREKPSLVHHHTIKPVIYGSLAARIVKVPAVVDSITGLGYIFTQTGWKASPLRAIVMAFYRLALKQQKVHLIFENIHDQGFFIENRIIRVSQSSVIEGVGVDIHRFEPQPEVEGKPLVVMPARLLRDKGVEVLVEAAKRLRGKNIMRFALVGRTDPGNPTHIDESQLENWAAEELIEYWGFRQDMVEVYRQAHIVCLPSIREGLPTVLIEAAASGRPIVASDVPGCREVVEHNINGLLVPPGDAQSLAEALAYLAVNPALRRQMGAAGRVKAVNRFSDEKIIAETVQIYHQTLDRA